MKLLITSGIVISLAAFSGAQQVKPPAGEVAQAEEYQSVKPSVVPPMTDTKTGTAAPERPAKAEIVKSTASPAAAPAPVEKKKNKKKKIAKPSAAKNVSAAPAVAAAGQTGSPKTAPGVIVIKPAEEKPAAAVVPAKPVEVKPAAALKSVQPAAKPAASVPAPSAVKPEGPKSAPEAVAAKPVGEKSAAAPTPAKPVEAKPAAALKSVQPVAKPAAAVPTPPAVKTAAPIVAPVKPAGAKPTAAPTPAKPVEAKPAAALKNVQPAAKPAASVPAKPVEAVKPALPAAGAVNLAQPKVKAEKTAVPVADSGGGFAVTRKHVVVKGETLWDLSNKYYKDPFKWGKIYNGNLDKISDPDRIYPSEEIFIPEVTEIVKPSPKPETVTDMDAPGSEEGVAISTVQVTAASAGQAAAASAPVGGGKSADSLLKKEPLEDLAAGMSEEMPDDLKEWSDNIKIAPGGWDPDGVITAIIKSDTDALPGSLTVSGEMVSIKAYKKGIIKPGDIVTSYMKGAIAVDKNGEELGRELQKTGTLEVVSVEGSVINARVVEASTSVDEDQLIVK